MANLRGGINRNENLHASISGTQSLNGRLNVGGGTKDYNKLDNKPQINGIELIGDITLEQLKAQSIFQYSEMPEANEDYLGKIVQYIGETDENYTNGYFYKCEEESESYFWTNIQIQDDEELEVPIYVITGDTQENIDKFNKCWQLFLDNKPFTAYYRSTEDSYIKYVPLIFEKHANTENIYSCTFIGWTGLSSQGILLSVGYIQGIRGNVGEYTAIRITDSSSMERQVPYIYYGNNDSGQGKVLTTKNVFAYTPTADYHPAVLKTVNDAVAKKQDIMQYETLPTASEDNEGQIAQYIGTTTNDYTQGYFYQCVSDGAVSPTYSWEAINVQAGGGGSVPMYFWDGTAVNNNDPRLEMFQEIFDKYRNDEPYILQTYKIFYDSANVRFDNGTTINLIVSSNSRTKVSSVMYLIGNEFGYYTDSGNGLSVYGVRANMTIDSSTNTVTSVSSISSNYSMGCVPYQWSRYTNGGYSTLSTTNTASYTPTAGSYNPATAVYAESMLEAIAPAYDSTSTYAVGDYVTRQGKLYVCSTAISQAEDWTAAHWTQTTVAGIIGNLNTILATLTTPSNGGGE